MPDRLRAAFLPTHLGGYLSIRRSGFKLAISTPVILNEVEGFLTYHLENYRKTLARLIARGQAEVIGLRPGAERPDKTPGGIGFVLIFWFFFIKEKER